VPQTVCCTGQLHLLPLPAMCPPNHCTHLTELRAVSGGRRVTESEPAACAASTRGGAVRPAAPGTPPPGVGFCNIATHCSGDTFLNTHRHTSDAATQRHTAVTTLLFIHRDTHIRRCNTARHCRGDTFLHTHRHTSDAATQRHTAVTTLLFIHRDTHIRRCNTARHCSGGTFLSTHRHKSDATTNCSGDTFVYMYGHTFVSPRMHPDMSVVNVGR